uniref:Uncharacterized protein n=1 Tax=Tanacetum cinerariifolium TaxID=118510 RepID=A0A6L2N0G1_TANCI|nr:hypothetical protein [Tanacetum cinerariifolium]
MSDSEESGVTYTDISSPFEELSDIGSPRADDHEYLMMLEDPYIEVALQAPPSPDCMPGPEEPEQAPPSPDYIPGPEHADDEIVAEDQSYAEDASPIAQSPEYETEPFETDESVATPPPHPAYRTTARISIPAPVPTPAWTDSEVVRLLAISSPPASPLTPWSSPVTQMYCMEDPEQAFVEYVSSRTNEAGGSINSITIHTEQQSPSYIDREKENKEEEYDLKNIHVNPPTPPDPSVTFIIQKVLKFNSFFKSIKLVPPSSNTELVCTKKEDGDVMLIEIVPKDDNSYKEEPEAGKQEVDYFDISSTRSELAYHKYLMCGPSLQYFYKAPSLWKDTLRTSRYHATLGMCM